MSSGAWLTHVSLQPWGPFFSVRAPHALLSRSCRAVADSQTELVGHADHEQATMTGQLPQDISWGPLVFEARRFVELRKKTFSGQQSRLMRGRGPGFPCTPACSKAPLAHLRSFESRLNHDMCLSKSRPPHCQIVAMNCPSLLSPCPCRTVLVHRGAGHGYLLHTERLHHAVLPGCAASSNKGCRMPCWTSNFKT